VVLILTPEPLKEEPDPFGELGYTKQKPQGLVTAPPPPPILTEYVLPAVNV
jgi:hypothetical protein